MWSIRLGAGAVALGVGLLVSGGVASAAPRDGHDSSSSSSDSGPASSHSPTSGGSSSPRSSTSTQRERDRAAGPATAREASTGPRTASSATSDTSPTRVPKTPTPRDTPRGSSASTPSTPAVQPAPAAAATAAKPATTTGSAPTPVAAPQPVESQPVPTTFTKTPAGSAAVLTTPVASGGAGGALPPPAATVTDAVVTAPVRAPAVPATPPATDTQMLVGALSLAGRDLEQQQPGFYGDLSNAQYWVGQHSENCNLMATGMVIGQLYGRTPTERQLVLQAMHTPSVDSDKPGQVMYRGLKSTDGVGWEDGIELMRRNGITGVKSQYRDADSAMAALKDALSSGKAVVVGTNGQVVYDYVEKETPPPADAQRGTHAVVVIAYDERTQTVYLNDSGWGDDINPKTGDYYGRAEAVPLDVFLKAWNNTSWPFLMITATLDGGGQAPQQGPWTTVQPREWAVDPAEARHLLHYRNAR
jgi:hypothetical protein